MADGTKIEWTRHPVTGLGATWNIITGCQIESPGCKNCYAMRLAGTRLQHHPSRQGLTMPSKTGPVWNGEIRFNEEWLRQPLKWKKPRAIFVCAHGDLFADGVTDDMLDRVFAVMALTPHHIYQVLTKRPRRMRAYLAKHDAHWLDPIRAEMDKLKPNGGSVHYDWPLPNVWLGVSAEDQERADDRIPYLLDTQAAIRFLSAEPLLGPIDLQHLNPGNAQNLDALTGQSTDPHFRIPGLDWIISGGESGPRARPMLKEWALWIRDDCVAAGVPFFFKQYGAWAPGECVTATNGVVDTAHWLGDCWIYGREDLAWAHGHRDDQPNLYRVGKSRAGNTLDGKTYQQFPEWNNVDH